ncbi:MAG: DUF4241 domain-containing protein [Oscillospiraceae bacterium]|nr:DUF4241 domain-containing protein [Oscillospiraceae bacterium]
MLFCEYDLNVFFDKDKYDILSIGDISLPTGEIVACDVIYNLGIKDNMIKPFINKVDQGSYPVFISAIKNGSNKGKYAALKIEINKEIPVSFEVCIKHQDVLKDLKPGEKYGFNVESGLVCICDTQVEALFEKQIDEFRSIIIDFISDKSRWTMWNLPETEFIIPMVSSGFGNGYYTAYWGLDKNDDVCSLILQFLQINEE